MRTDFSITLVSCANRHSGIGRYTRELHRFYLNAGLQSRCISREATGLLSSKTYFFPLPKPFRNQYGPFFLRLAARRIKSDVWHADYVDAGSVLGTFNAGAKRCITTVHDGIPFLYPKNKEAAARYKKQLEASATASDALIVVSEVSKRDLLRFTDIPESKIAVIYNGINHELFYPEPAPANAVFTIRYHGGLSTGHKNTPLLLKTARILEDRGVSFRMELAGANPNATPLPRMASEMRLKNVYFTGFIPDEKIRRYLSGGDLYVYPSLYEGFGFTPLEAMACGAPVLSSNGGSLQEILTGAAVLAEPDPEIFAAEVMRLMEDSAARKSMRIRGLEHVKQFTWDACAKATLALYQ